MQITSETSKILYREHEFILKVVKALEFEVGEINRKEIDVVFFEKVVDFIRNYADKLHHAKEEDILFKEFNVCAEDGGVHCNPVGQMLHEHDDGRGFVKMIEIGLKQNDKQKIIEGANGYIRLIRDHIFKEDNILYPMADDALSDEVKKNMLNKFKKIDSEKKVAIKKFEKFANEVAGE